MKIGTLKGSLRFHRVLPVNSADKGYKSRGKMRCDYERGAGQAGHKVSVLDVARMKVVL